MPDNTNLGGLDDRSLDPNQILANRNEATPSVSEAPSVAPIPSSASTDGGFSKMMDSWMKANPTQSIDFNLPSVPSSSPLSSAANIPVSNADDFEKKMGALASETRPEGINQNTFVKREQLGEDYFSGRYDKYFLGEDNEQLAYLRQGNMERLGNIINNTAVRFTKTLAESTVGVIAGAMYQLDPSDQYSYYDNPTVKKLHNFGEKYERPVFESNERKAAPFYSPTYWFSGNTVNNVLGMVGDLAAFYVTGRVLAAPIAGMLGRTATTALRTEELLSGEALKGIETMAVPEYTEAVTKFGRVVGAMEESEAKQIGLQLEESLKKIQLSNLADAEKLKESTKLISDLSSKYTSRLKTVGAVQQGVASVITNLGMAQSSGYDAKISFKTKLIQDIKDKNREPTEEELQKIEEMSNLVGRNTAIVMTAMGAITLHGITKGLFAKGEAKELAALETKDIVRKQTEKELAKTAEKEAVVGAEKAAAATTERYTVKTWKPDATTTAGRVAQKTLYGIKKAPAFIQSHVDLWPGIGLVEFGLAPRTIEDYYEKKYKNPKSEFTSNLAEALGKNVQNIFTKEGITDFFLGVVGGMPFEVGRKISERKAIAQNTAEALKGMNAADLDKVVKAMNYTYSKNSMKGRVDSSRRGLALRDEYIEALIEGNEERAKTLKQQQLENWVYPFIKYGQKRFADSEIQNMKLRAATDEGIRELQKEKMIPDGDNIEELRKDYNKSMDEIQEYVDNAEKYYNALRLKYGGYLKDEHIEKLMALSGAIDDASKRVKTLSDEVAKAPIGTDPEFMKAYKKLIDFYVEEGSMYEKEGKTELLRFTEKEGKLSADPEQLLEMGLFYEGTTRGFEEREDSEENMAAQEKSMVSSLIDMGRGRVADGSKQVTYDEKLESFVKEGKSQEEAKKLTDQWDAKGKELEQKLQDLRKEISDVSKGGKGKKAARPIYKVGTVADAYTRGILKRIDAMKSNLNPDQKMELANKVIDTFKLQILKKQYMTEYRDIISNPELHEDNVTEGIASTGAKTDEEDDVISPSDLVMKTNNKEGEKRFKRGTVYHSDKIISITKDKEQRLRYKNFRSFFIPEDSDPILDGQPVVKEVGKKKNIFIVDADTKQGQYVPQEVLSKYKFVSEKELDKKGNENLRFFIDNKNTPFEVKFFTGEKDERGKKKFEWVKGKLIEFDPEDPNEFLFMSDKADENGKHRYRNIKRSDFRGEWPSIKSLDPLSGRSKEWVEKNLSELERRAEERLATQNVRTLVNFIKEKEESLKELYDNLKENNDALKERTKELDDIKTEIELSKEQQELDIKNLGAGAGRGEKRAVKRTWDQKISALEKAAGNVSNIIKDLETRNESLRSAADDIENQIIKLEDIDRENLPKDMTGILNFIDDNRANLEIAQEETQKQISALQSVIDTAKDTLAKLLQNIKDRMKAFSNKYGVPFLNENALQSAIDRLSVKGPGADYDNAVKAVKDEFNSILDQMDDYERKERDVNMDASIQKASKEIEALQKKIDDYGKDLKLQEELFDRFKKAWEEYEKEEEIREKMGDEKYLKILSKLQGNLDALYAGETVPENIDLKLDEVRTVFESYAKVLGRESEDSSIVVPDNAVEDAQSEKNTSAGNWVERFNMYMKKRNLGFPVPKDRKPGERYIAEEKGEEAIVVITRNNQKEYFDVDEKDDNKNFIRKTYQYGKNPVVDNAKDAKKGQIAYVHVYRPEGESDWYFINQNGKLLNKITEAKSDPATGKKGINFKELIFSNAETHNTDEFRRNEAGEIRKTRKGRNMLRFAKGFASDKEVNAIKNKSLKERTARLKSESAMEPVAFKEANGLPREKYHEKGHEKAGQAVVQNTSIGKSGLALDGPENSLKGKIQIITVSDTPDGKFGTLNVGENSMKFPTAMPILVNRNNGVIVNQKRFSPKEVNHLYNIIKAISVEFVQTGKLNTTAVDYLSRVLFMTKTAKKSPYAIFINSKGDLAFNRVRQEAVTDKKTGETKTITVEESPLLIKFLPGDIELFEKEIKQELSRRFYAVSNAALKEEGFTEITDVEYEKGKPVFKTREWVSAEDFYASDYIRIKGEKPVKRPEDTRPLSTNVVENYDPERNVDTWKGPLQNKYIVPLFDVEYPEIRTKEKKGAKTTSKKKVAGEKEATEATTTFTKKDGEVTGIQTIEKGKKKTYKFDGSKQTLDRGMVYSATVENGQVLVEVYGPSKKFFETQLEEASTQKEKDEILAIQKDLNTQKRKEGVKSSLEKKFNSLYEEASIVDELDQEENTEEGTEEEESKTDTALSITTKKGKVYIFDNKKHSLEDGNFYTATYNDATNEIEIIITDPKGEELESVSEKLSATLTKNYVDDVKAQFEAAKEKKKAESETKTEEEESTDGEDPGAESLTETPPWEETHEVPEETAIQRAAAPKKGKSIIDVGKEKAAATKAEETKAEEPVTRKKPKALRQFVPGEIVEKTDDVQKVEEFFKETLPNIKFENIPQIVKEGDVYAWGYYLDHYVALVTGAPLGTGYHEAYHAVWDSFLTDIEKAEILDEIRSRKGSFELYGETYDFATADYDTLMERMAEEFRMYKEKHPEYTKPSKLTNFFRRIWDFIQHLFGKPTTINEVFEKMNSSWYRDSRFVNSPDSKPRFSKMKNVTKVEHKQVLESTAERIVNSLRMTNGGLLSIAEGTIISDMIKPAFEWMKDYYENENENSPTYDQSAHYRAVYQVEENELDPSLSRAQKDANNKKIEKDLNDARTLWNKMKNAKGDDFSDELKQDLESFFSKFGLKFIKSKQKINRELEKKQLENKTKEENAEIANTELFEQEMGEDNRDRSYDRKELQIDLSRNAPDEIKLLFAFLTKPDKADGNPNLGKKDNELLDAVNSKRNTLLLPELLQGHKWMYATIDKLSGTIDPVKMQGRMFELAKNNPELIKVYNSVYKSAENLKDWLLQISFSKFVAKYKPDFSRWIMKRDSDNSFISSSEGAGQILINEWESILKGSAPVNSKGEYIIDAKKINAIDLNVSGIDAANKNTLRFFDAISFPMPLDIFKRLNSKERASLIKDAIQLKKSLLGGVQNRQVRIDREDIDSEALRNIANLVSKVDPEKFATQHNRPDGNTIQNHIQFNGLTREISRIIEAGSLQNLQKTHPNLFTDTWCSSLSESWLKAGGPLFDLNGEMREEVKNGTIFKFTIPEGLANANNNYNPATVTTDMTEPIRFFHSLMLNIEGISNEEHRNVGIFHNFVPGDSTTDGSIKMPLSITWKDYKSGSAGKKIFNDAVIEYLRDEINLIKDNRGITDNNRVLSKAALTKAEGERENAYRLQTFKDLLPKELVKKIEDYANSDSKIDTDAFLDRNIRTQVIDAVKETMEKWAENSMEKLQDAGVIKYLLSKDKYLFHKLSDQFVSKEKSKLLSEEEVLDIFRFRNMNVLMHNTMMRKMFHGPWYEVPDGEKRDKGDYTCTELTYHNNPKFTEYMNTEEQMIGDVKLSAADLGHHTYSEEFSYLAYDNDKGVVSRSINKIKEALGKDDASKYEKIEDGDGQSLMATKYWKEYVIRSGDKWTDDHEAQHQYDIARHILADANGRDGKAEKKYIRPELKAACEEIVAKGNPQFAIGTSRKPLGAGFIKSFGAKNKTPLTQRMKFFIKTSTYRLSYDTARERGLEDLYWFLNDNNIAVSGPQSMLKVGNLPNSPELVKVNETGKAMFNLDKVSASEIDKHVANASWSDFSKILETEHDGHGKTKSSQLNSIIVNGTFDNGLPLDFYNIEKDNFEEKFDEWIEMSDEDKQKVSPLYKLVKQNTDSINGLLEKGMTIAMDKLGVEFKDGDFVFSDAQKLVDFITKKGKTGNLPDNVAEALEAIYNPSTGMYELKNELETNPNYSSIRKMLWSVVDKSVTRMKVNGNDYINVSPVLWEQQGRQGMFKKADGTWVDVTPEMFKKMSEADRKKIVPTSSDLKTYEKGEVMSDGTIAETSRAEVYLPNYFKEQMLAWARRTNKRIPNEYQLYKYLTSTEEGKKLLTSAAFRVPVQGYNSVEALMLKPFRETNDPKTFKLFLPADMGDTVVVPSEIVTKSGTDFDVDKLGTYHYNFRINKDGFPELVKFHEAEYINKISVLRDIYDQTYSKAEREQSATGKFLSAVLGEPSLDDKVPTFEEFVEKVKEENDPYKFNSFEAIQNKYFDTVQSLVLHPHNYEQLMKPNSSDELKAIGKRLNELEKKSSGRVKNDIDYSRMLNPIHISEARQQYLDAKGKVIGIAAQNNTYHALASTQFIPMTGFKLHLPHRQIEMEGKKITTFSSGFNSKGGMVGDIISQVINGGVDAIKDDFLIDLVGNNELIPTSLFLSRCGVDPEYVFTFLRQPIVQQFVKMYSREKGIIGISNEKTFYPGKKALTETIKAELMKATYPSEANAEETPKLKDGEMFEMADLEKMIGDVASAKGRLKSLTPEYRKKQRQVLKEFIKYWEKTDELFQEQVAIKWDNMGRYTDTDILTKEISFNNASEADAIGTIKPIMENTFQGTYKNVLLQSRDMMYKIMKVTSSADLQEVFEKIANTRMKSDDKERLMTLALHSYIDYAVHTKSSFNNKRINRYVKDVLVGTNNTADLFTAFRKAAKGDIKELVDTVLGELKPVRKQNIRETKNLMMSRKPGSPTEKDIVTEALRELQRNPHNIMKTLERDPSQRTNVNLFDRLVLTGIIQSGVRTTGRNTWTDLIPHEVYTSILKPAIEAIKSGIVENFKEVGALYRGNWQNDNLVPRIRSVRNRMTDEYEKPYYSAKSKEMEAAAKEKGLVAPKFLKIKTNRGVSNSQFVKTIDYSGSVPKVRLFKRVEDVKGPYKGGKKKPAGKESYKDANKKDQTYHLYMQVNAWGDGRDAREYYDHPRESVLDRHEKVMELIDQQAIQLDKSGKYFDVEEAEVDDVDFGSYLGKEADVDLDIETAGEKEERDMSFQDVREYGKRKVKESEKAREAKVKPKGFDLSSLQSKFKVLEGKKNEKGNKPEKKC